MANEAELHRYWKMRLRIALCCLLVGIGAVAACGDGESSRDIDERDSECEGVVDGALRTGDNDPWDNAPPYSETLIVHDGDLYLRGERFIIRSVDFVVSWPEDRAVCASIMDQIIDVGANSFRYGFHLEHDIFDLAEKKGLFVLPLLFNSWTHHMSPDEVRQAVGEFEHHDNLLAWVLGNELWNDDLSIPADLLWEQYVAAVEEDDLARPVIYGNHMMLNHPVLDRIPPLANAGFGPIDFVDVIGWNPYPFLRALSLYWMIETYWASIRPFIEQFSPALAEAIDALFDWYAQWAQNMPDWMYDSAFGMDGLLSTYADNAESQDWDGREYHPKPWVLTEWGFTDSPRAIENDFAVIHGYIEDRSLDGLNFHHWMWLDVEPDGIIDAPEAYGALMDAFAQVQEIKFDGKEPGPG